MRKTSRKSVDLTEARSHRENHIETVITPHVTGQCGHLLCSPHQSVTTSFLFFSVPLCLREKNVPKIGRSHRGTEPQREPHQNSHHTSPANDGTSSAVFINHSQHHSCSSPCLCASVRKTFPYVKTPGRRALRISSIVRIFCQSHKLLWSQPAIRVDILRPNDGIISLSFIAIHPDVR